MIEDTAMKIEDPCSFSQGTQTYHPIADTTIQTNVEEYVRVVCIIQEAVEVLM